MNIGIFTDVYYPFINGVVTSTKILEDELRKLGHNVYIFAPKDPKVTEEESFVYRLPSLPLISFPAIRLSSVFSLKYFLIIKKLKLDVIHTQTEFPIAMFGRAVAKMLNLPIIHTYHTMYEEYVHYIARGHLITPQMARDYSRVYCNAAAAVIAPTKKVENLLKHYGVKKPIYVIPTGVNLEPFRSHNFSDEQLNEVKVELGIEPQDKTIIFVGRIAKEKSIDVLINQMPKLLERIPNARLVLIGNGPALKDLQQLAASLSLENKIVFAGERPWATIGKYYHIGDVFVSASVTETQGLTYIEAMAASVPVVAKKDDSLQNLITDKYNGRLFSNDEELLEALCDVLGNKNHAESIVNKAIITVEPYSSVQFAKKVEKVYHYVISDKKDNHCKEKKFTIKLNK